MLLAIVTSAIASSSPERAYPALFGEIAILADALYTKIIDGCDRPNPHHFIIARFHTPDEIAWFRHGERWVTLASLYPSYK
ncbi:MULTISPECIES: hypothetical protein [Cyanophyceae]|uniref:hypothetical protein n=1 Tax=Cyanophyceae TaxID=3028117 RepID=UPI001689BCF0|nr:hypothetical protein [Trichocoleus sp. FACHB-40]MBD2003699.1 hypothetical protein [Trichocoleus sp. FACHB-40]